MITKVINVINDWGKELNDECEMTEGIRAMEVLGYKIEVAPRSKDIVRKFAKFDDEGNITDTINYFYNKDSGIIEVFTNNLTYECGSSLDKDLLNAVLVNFMELENEME